ncbi:polyhydroxyalkanoate biosynthesis repressor PhaR [Bacillus sp. V5-8f]|uniref:polyhydroxyalkanoate biosynthesis repressor PhaR n=1 Tax=Bacillus sp. V5-8f TaxID=2053044 RepID=UPI0015E12E5B|nr:polyhydroxyalkanoate biosynthesis repressor PhaR [Bacillus sp. V5-8f]
MAKQKTFDPYDMFKKFSNQWEKQMNDFIYVWTNNSDFVRFSRLNSDVHARYLELYKRNQEFFANQLNLPTKSDMANVAKLAIQSEEKLDSLEEQIWTLQDSVDSSNKENETMVEVSRDIIKLAKQLKTEQLKAKKELAETKELRAELQEVKSELSEIHSLREEIANLKVLMAGNVDIGNEGEAQEESLVEERELELVTK